MIARLVFLAAMAAASSGATLELPANARQTERLETSPDSYEVPLAPFDGERIPAQRVDGIVMRQAWQVAGTGITPLQILTPLREQLEDSGYTVALDCVAATCGGFDFRFGTEVLPAPAIFVDLRNFHFMSFVQGDTDQPVAAVTLLVSTTSEGAYVQLIEARPANAEPLETAVSAKPPGDQPPTSPTISTRAASTPDDLVTLGHFALDGLEFETGATRLLEGETPVLDDLATFLIANPDLRIALVGHTDSTGSLAGNIRISKQRAESVRQKLVDDYGIAAARMDAEGMGYLAPRASNLTETGRDLNRRVEAIALSAN